MGFDLYQFTSALTTPVLLSCPPCQDRQSPSFLWVRNNIKFATYVLSQVGDLVKILTRSYQDFTSDLCKIMQELPKIFATTCHDPVRSCHDPVRSCHDPVRSCHNPVRSCHDPVRSCHDPVRSCHDPVRSCHDPVRSGQDPVRSCHNPVRSCHAMIL